MKVIAVTACPSGVAHTYMAAEAIKKSCDKAGIECCVETQGSIGIQDRLTSQDIMEAKAVILTTDMPIKGDERFNNMPKIRMGAGAIIKSSDQIIEKIQSQFA